MSRSRITTRGPSQSATTPPRFLGVLRHRNFALFWFSLVFSNTGTWMQLTVVGWLVFDMTHSPAWLGVVGAARAFPMIALPFFGGVIADRMDRRTLLWMTQSSQALVSIVLTALVAAGAATVWNISALTLIAGIAHAFDQPTRQAIVPALVPRQDLRRAIALHSVVFTGGALLGPAIAGLLAPTLGLAMVLLINTLSFTPVFVALALLNLPSFQARRHEHVLESVRDGLRFAFSRELIVVVILVSAIASLFGRSYQMLAPVFAKDVLLTDITGLGWLTSAPGLGAILGACIVAGVHRMPPNGRLAGFAVAGYLVALIVFALSNNFIASIVSLIIVGFFNTMFSAAVRTILQLATPETYYGRVMSLNTITFIGFTPLGSLIIGSIAEPFGIQFATLVGALVVAIACAWAWIRHPTLRKAA